jgi:putative tricarboxylic transport membrane protein
VATTLTRIEIGVAIVLLLLGAFATWEAAGMPQGTPALPGPGMVPMTLGILLVVSAAGLIAWRIKARPAEDEVVALGHRHITLAVTAILAAGFLFERAGFLITSTLLLFVLLWSLSPLGWWRSLIAAVGASIAARYFFQTLLNVSLPPPPFF